MFPEVLPLRRSSQLMVRELGFLESSYATAGLPHSYWHALIEIEAGIRSATELAAQLRLDKSTTSRIVERLRKDGWITMTADPQDARRTSLSLSKRGARDVERIHGHANGRVQAALALLNEDDRQIVTRGMALYARALERARLRSGYQIRPLKKADNRAVENIIRTVMPEFGADGPGFAIHDPEVRNMYAAYSDERAAYFVLMNPHGEIVGGAGVAHLSGAPHSTCELRKMYLLPSVRSLGFGQTMLDLCLQKAVQLGFTRCYLETLNQMRQARRMYEKNGFKLLTKAEGKTGHFGCDAWYAKAL